MSLPSLTGLVSGSLRSLTTGSDGWRLNIIGLRSSWEKGERLAKLISHRRTLLVLDGLEPLQNPPGPQEGRVRDPSLQALLRELAAYNRGLCVITTRLPIADVADHEHTSAPRRELDELTSDAGAKLLRGLGVKGDEAEL